MQDFMMAVETDEVTAVRFTLEGSKVVNVTNEPRSLVALTREGAGKESGARPSVSGTSGYLDPATGQVMQQ